MENTYQFDRKFQIKIIASMLLDPIVLKSYRDILAADYFEAEDTRILSKLILDYSDRYSLVPDHETLESLIFDYQRTHRVSVELEAQLNLLLKEVYATSLDHSKFILDQIRPFGRRQRIKQAYLSTSPLIEDLEKYEEKIWRSLTEAFHAGAGGDSTEVDFRVSWETLPERHQQFQDSESTGRVPTGITKLDQTLDGGLGMYELGMLESVPGLGKSRMLIQLGAAAVLNNKNLLFVTNELHPLDIELMFATRFSGLTATQLRNPAIKDRYRSAMEQVMQHKSFIKIEYYAPFRMSIAALRSKIARLENMTGQKVDMIIIDMFDRIGGINPKDIYGSQYFLTKELMAVVADHDTRMWVSTHVKGIGYTAHSEGKILGMEDSGGSVAKPQDVDILMSLNQTAKQAEQQVAYLGLPKIRRSEGSRKVKTYFDKGICLMLDWDDWYKYQVTQGLKKEK